MINKKIKKLFLGLALVFAVNTLPAAGLKEVLATSASAITTTGLSYFIATNKTSSKIQEGVEVETKDKVLFAGSILGLVVSGLLTIKYGLQSLPNLK
jgi:hypothetical protein